MRGRRCAQLQWFQGSVTVALAVMVQRHGERKVLCPYVLVKGQARSNSRVR
jgi:hypothetical protein